MINNTTRKLISLQQCLSVVQWKMLAMTQNEQVTSLLSFRCLAFSENDQNSTLDCVKRFGAKSLRICHTFMLYIHIKLIVNRP